MTANQINSGMELTKSCTVSLVAHLYAWASVHPMLSRLPRSKRVCSLLTI